MRLVQNHIEIIINPPKLYSKDAGLLYIISISEILVYFGEENSTKLDELMAFTKLGNKLITKRGVILRFLDARYLRYLARYQMPSRYM
jgi:hypothetical protein